MKKAEISVISNEDELKNMFVTKGGNKEKDLKANTMLEKMGFKDEELTSKTHDDIFIELMDKELIFNIGLLIDKYINKKEMLITPEYPVVTNNNFVIGYIDILLSTYNETIPIEIKTNIENYVGATIRQINTYKLHIKNSDFVIIAPEITNKQKDVFKMSGIYSMSIKDVYETGIEYKKLKDNFQNQYIPKIISNLRKENETTIDVSCFSNYFEFNIIHRIIKDILIDTDICIKDCVYFPNRIVFCYKSYMLEIENRKREETKRKQKEEIEKRQKEKQKSEEKLRKEFKNRNPTNFEYKNCNSNLS